MARLEHVALWCSDLNRLCDFYARFFGARVGPLYQNPGKGFASRFLSFEGGARVELMTSTTLALEATPPDMQRFGLTHLAISLGTTAAVDALTAELRRQGVPVLDGPRRTGDGCYESVILDPEGNRVELCA
jgi:lactoylglutathione lyase